MRAKHLISKQQFNLRLTRHEEAQEIQRHISRLYSERLLPAFEALFDRMAGHDQLIRIGKIELDLGAVSRRELFSGEFVRKLIGLLEGAIAEASDGSSPEASVQPLRVGRFGLWLYFLEHGCLPAHASQPDSLAEWQRHIFETLAADVSAVQSLRQLLSARPVTLERLIVQYDEAFLQQIVTLVTAHRHDALPAAIREMSAGLVECIQSLSANALRNSEHRAARVENTANALLRMLTRLVPALKSDSARKAALKKQLLQLLGQEIVSPAALSQWLARPEFWRIALHEAVTPEEMQAVSTRMAKMLQASSTRRNLAQSSASSLPETPPSAHLLRQMEISLWRMLLEEAIIRGHQADTPGLLARVCHHEALRHLYLVMSKALAERKPHSNLVANAIQAFPEPAQKPLQERNKPTPSDVAMKPQMASAGENVFYIPNAGVVLLHPFLARFFGKLGLIEGPTFKDEWSRGIAVCLLHHLATGELRTPEYQLVFPKFLCGMPLHAPLDHTITISPEAQVEADQLLKAAIEHWGALGHSSPGALREGFLQRAGKLERRQSGWFLQMERNTLDILLDRLPMGWGIGMVKLPWMEDLLRVEWG